MADIQSNGTYIDVCVLGEAAAIDIKYLNNQFKGSINIIQDINGSDITFKLTEEAGKINLGMKAIGGHDHHWTEISSLPTCNFSLTELMTAILSPCLVPGLIGVDWADVNLVLSSGAQGTLVMQTGEPDICITEACDRLAKHLAELDLKAKATLASLALRNDQFDLLLYEDMVSQVDKLARLEAQGILAMPFHDEVLAKFTLLAIY